MDRRRSNKLRDAVRTHGGHGCGKYISFFGTFSVRLVVVILPRRIIRVVECARLVIMRPDAPNLEAIGFIRPDVDCRNTTQEDN
jgi:hypothetical protein